MPFQETGTITLKLLAQDLASGNVGKFIASMDKAAKQGGLLGWAVKGTAMSMGAMLNPALLVSNAIGKVTDFTGDSISAASDQAEALSKVTVVFGDQAKQIEDWAKSASTSMGMSETAALSAAGTLGNLFDGLGIAEDAGLSMSKTITQLAADLGSFNNVATDDAMLALRSGLLGEAEPMRKFGSALSAARVEAYGFANGLTETVIVAGKTKRVMSEAHKVQARYALMLEDTKNAQGDFARTSDGLANSQKTLDSRIQDLTASLGKFLVGPAADFTGWLASLIGGSMSGDAAVDAMTQRLIGLAQASKDGGGTIFDSIADGMNAVEDAANPQQSEWRDLWDSIKGVAEQAKITETPLERLWYQLKEGGKTSEQARAEVDRVIGSVRLMGETTTAVTPLLSTGWAEAMGKVADETEGAAYTVEQAMADMRSAVKRTVNGMNGTVADAMDPWKQAWKDMAAYAKDPFSPKNFEDRMERYSRRAAQKAAEAAENGLGRVSRRWTRLSEAAKDPVIQAMTLIGMSVDEALAAIAGVRSAGAQLRDFLDFGDLFDPAGDGGNTGGVGDYGGNGGGGGWKKGRNGKWHRRAMGGPVSAGRTYLVGERGPELLHMGRGSGGGTIIPNHDLGGGGSNGSGGTTIHVHFHGVVAAPSEAEAARLASVIGPGLTQWQRRQGVVR